MELDQIDPTLVTPDGIDNVLRFLPELLAPEATYGDDLNAKLVGPQEIEIGGGGLDDEGIAFVEACYAANLVQSFDWMRWTEESPGIAGSAEFIGSADLRAIIALLTTHIRGCRFANGHLVEVFRDGLIAEILLRLSQIHSGDQPDEPHAAWRHAPNDRDVISQHLRFEEDRATVTIKVQLIRWPAPYEPDSTWVDAAVLPAGSGDRARDFATSRVLKSTKYFRICRECGERNAIGHLMSDKPGAICHGCAQRNHGVVF